MIQARYNVRTNQYRCGMDDCNSLLCKGKVIKGVVEIKCKCGTINFLPYIDDDEKGKPFQERLAIRRK